jgi:hypothetical protein
MLLLSERVIDHDIDLDNDAVPLGVDRFLFERRKIASLH